MKFIVGVLLAVAVCQASASLVLDPEDLPKTNVAGECPSGLPLDGRFKSCSLSRDTWRVGARELGNHLQDSDITFPADFSSLPPSLDNIISDNADTCSIAVPSSGVVFQHLSYNLYAHYRLSACAKVHGNSPCHVEVRDWRNSVVDHLEFRPPANRSCANTGSGVEECARWSQPDNTFKFTRVLVRYQGLVPSVVAVRMTDRITDNSNDIVFNLVPGEEFNITASDMGLDALPDSLVLIAGETINIIDIMSLSGDSVILPGMRFGDNSMYLMAKMWTKESSSAAELPVCPVSEGADLLACPCEDVDVTEVCMESLKGFAALPGEEYYIGLISDECSCEFDTVCLHQVGNEEGYFGLNWILTGNTTSL